MTRTVTDDIKATYGWGPWIDWAGRTKKCPLAAGTRHQVRFRNGSLATDDAPETWRWKNVTRRAGDFQRGMDIVAYRIRKGG